MANVSWAICFQLYTVRTHINVHAWKATCYPNRPCI